MPRRRARTGCADGAGPGCVPGCVPGGVPGGGAPRWRSSRGADAGSGGIGFAPAPVAGCVAWGEGAMYNASPWGEVARGALGGAPRWRSSRGAEPVFRGSLVPRRRPSPDASPGVRARCTMRRRGVWSRRAQRAGLLAGARRGALTPGLGGVIGSALAPVAGCVAWGEDAMHPASPWGEVARGALGGVPRWRSSQGAEPVFRGSLVHRQRVSPDALPWAKAQRPWRRSRPLPRWSRDGRSDGIGSGFRGLTLRVMKSLPEMSAAMPA
jgi:hypothetical protein